MNEFSCRRHLTGDNELHSQVRPATSKTKTTTLHQWISSTFRGAETTQKRLWWFPWNLASTTILGSGAARPRPLRCLATGENLQNRHYTGRL